MRAALHLEALKLRRATTARAASLIVVLLVPAMSAAFLAVVRADTDSVLASKVGTLLVDTGWGGITGFAAQITSVGALLAVGVVVCWVFGREFTDNTFGALFATPTPRGSIAAAKLIVVVVWGFALSVVAAALTLVAGMLIGLGAPDATAWAGAWRVFVVGVLTVLLTLPFALVASAARGYLAGVSALLGLVVVTQIVVASGAGAWFPYASPGLWSGLGGPQLADEVTASQLLLALPVGAAAAAGTWWWWRNAKVQ